MAFGSLGSSHSRPNAEINTTPLVDVMLVLLVIFILTAPLFTHTVKLDLPRAAHRTDPQPPPAVTLSLDAAGALFWDNAALAESELAPRLAALAAQQPQPELHLRADRETRYERIAQLMAAARNAGVNRIGFVTDPQPAATH
ncbi:MAG TPA: biopolymer transporter ExbD [Plasticicumulans sp.]|uniref:ExbD/TolR family protein n=1 Tax=Plasticicumulans sp. TaxID=2307179 RepID=UPI002C508C3B|nr:biopolymer transporter ExbD [Plasticicumulans sp.]HMW31168.1 biopolymer transporter ExbD [Plasticicumulans sp.]HMW44222.1 biopolymer transporter ExbD [Plasticicumulans sp.]HMZ12141.1 biopolymer transporter ExbD [Plasticicumulans sp.]HNF65872.1 biopolymer transporter ExbD [Plasticicumulans sp.]HNG48935.1 biopolymer transporter ExbD [Plasticicumulans sp.]